MYLLRVAELVRAGPPPSGHSGPACRVAAAASPRGTPPPPTRLDTHTTPAPASSTRPRPTCRPAVPPSLLLSFAPWAQRSVLSEPSECGSAKPPAYAEPPSPGPARSLSARLQTPVCPHWAAPAPPRPRRRGSALAAGGLRCVLWDGFEPGLHRGICPILNTWDRREALGSQLFSGACVSQIWCLSVPGPSSHGPAHQRQLATRVPGTLPTQAGPRLPDHSGCTGCASLEDTPARCPPPMR